MKTLDRRTFFSKLLTTLGLIFFSLVILNSSKVITLTKDLPLSIRITINGCLVSLQTLSFCTSLIISNGKNFKGIISANGLVLVSSALGCYLYGFTNNGALFSLSVLATSLSIVIYRYTKKLLKDEEELDKAAFTDQLTGCLNRRGLLKELSLKTDNSKNFYLIFLDLDNFKQVNDSLGHEAGDSLLKDLAEIWANIKTSSPFILCRLGGDEFAIIYESSSKDETTSFVNELIKSTSIIQSKFSSYVTASAGIAHFDTDAQSITQLLSYADTAMYRAKLMGKNCYCFFDQEMYQEIRRRYLTEKDLKNAIKRNLFTLMYQPQYEIDTHKLIGFESLIRLKDSNGKYIDTYKFIEVAERSGLIYDIDMWVMHNAMKEMKDFVLEHPDIEISINISGKHITNNGFVEKIIDSLSQTGFPPKNLKIEITESSFIRFIDDATKVIHRLKVLGIKTALDDFGTGYSSLNYLSKLPVDTLKIDKSFVDKMLLKENDKSFVDIIIKLGHLMNCRVIAEGVETEEQLKLLSELECDFIQGYIWGKPILMENIEDCIIQKS